MTLAAGALLAAVLELDATHVAQLLVSRPFFVGAALGALSGRPAEGAGLGASFELLALPEAPLGGHLAWSAPVAAAVAALADAGGVSLVTAFGGGLLAGWAHSRLERVERGLRAPVSEAVARGAAAGETPAWGALLAGSAAAHCALTAALVAVAVVALRRADPALMANLPPFLLGPLGSAALCAPLFGAASLVVRGARA